MSEEMPNHNEYGDGLFRYCVYCGTYCEADESDHMADCPFVTGIWPVRVEDQVLCPHCGKDVRGPALCSECGSPLEVGDHYVLRDSYTHELVVCRGHGAILEPLCIGCAALEGLLADA